MIILKYSTDKSQHILKNPSIYCDFTMEIHIYEQVVAFSSLYWMQKTFRKQ